MGGAIRLGERMRFRDESYKHWNQFNHAVAVMDATGRIVEMVGRGATEGNASKYLDQTYWHFPCPHPELASKAVEFWEWALEHHAHYNWAAAASDGFTCLTGSSLVVGTSGRMICSGLLAAGYCYAGFPEVKDWAAGPSHVFPTELGHRFAA